RPRSIEDLCVRHLHGHREEHHTYRSRAHILSRVTCRSALAGHNLAAVSRARQPRENPHTVYVAVPFLDPRLTERRNPRTTEIDLASPAEIVELINAEDATVAGAVATQRDEIARAIELA